MISCPLSHFCPKVYNCQGKCKGWGRAVANCGGHHPELALLAKVGGIFQHRKGSQALSTSYPHAISDLHLPDRFLPSSPSPPTKTYQPMASAVETSQSRRVSWYIVTTAAFPGAAQTLSPAAVAAAVLPQIGPGTSPPDQGLPLGCPSGFPYGKWGGSHLSLD